MSYPRLDLYADDVNYLVAKSSSTPCDPTDYSLPGSSVHEISSLSGNPERLRSLPGATQSVNSGVRI